ncbi:NADH-quinone oxidoreductase subunit N [Jiulongibacter sediminis]|jgi:NADH-quinone oxidoreductase subunit N|uniref:NADH-quinone oxidoreductase subunit N n=1 Tax=Jiulongibacter sediminis TaxID=1605367 RepID=UPI0026F1A3C4|nr:NADH-quinone oxidoreductase subunit N [Jiulongibacter sediminis]
MQKQLSHILESGSKLGVELLLFAGIITLILLISLLSKNEKTRNIIWLVSLLVTLGSFVLLTQTFVSDELLFNGLIQNSSFSHFGKSLVLISTLIILLHIKVMKYELEGEYYVLILGIAFSLSFLLMSSHLLSMFVAMEAVSLSSYMLVAFRQKAHNLEAGIKYLIFGATSTALMLYGASFLYGMTGSLSFEGIQQGLTSGTSDGNMVQIALLMTLAGPLFKLSAAPFHIWAPDVYEATPTPLISYLAIAPKIGGLYIAFRLLETIPYDHTIVLSIIILLSILIGNFSALTQKNAKRMMGYSGIAQSGFLLVGLLGLEITGLRASGFYMAVYIFMTSGAFLLLDMVEKHTKNFQFVDMAGLSQRFVFFGIIGLIFMVGLTGLPPTAGFTAKFLVFTNVWEQYSGGGHKILLWVLLFGLINTAISIYYYFKIPYFMFLKTPPENKSESSLNITQLSLLTILAFAVLALFFAPQWVQNQLF